MNGGLEWSRVQWVKSSRLLITLSKKKVGMYGNLIRDLTDRSDY